MTTLTKTRKPDAGKANQYFHAKNEFTTGPMELSHMIFQGCDVSKIDQPFE